jgi:hypothetical protein
MFLLTIVEDWRIDGGRRVPDKTDGNLYLLNTNRMYEITSDFEDKQRMRFFDNHSNSRDGGAWMKIWDTALSNITDAADTDIGSKDVTFNKFIDNDPTLATTEITIGKAAIAYCYPYNHDGNSAYTWILYSDGGWDMIRILVSHDYTAVYMLLEENQLN